MWNYNIVLPTLLVLSVFVVYYFCHPRLPLRINRTFFTLLIVHLLTVLLDYFATLALDYPDRVSQTTAFSLNLFFFFAMMARSACFFEFTRDALKLDGDHAWSSFFTPVVLTVSELVVLSNVFVPTLFSLADPVRLPSAVKIGALQSAGCQPLAAVGLCHALSHASRPHFSHLLSDGYHHHLPVLSESGSVHLRTGQCL